MEMSVVVFPIPLGARKHPLAPGVCGKGSGGFRKFQWTSAGRLSAIFSFSEFFSTLLY